jgi:hypothetical protein
MNDLQRRRAYDHGTRIAEIRKTLLEMCRPFGTISHWEVASANDGLYQCIVRLHQPSSHPLVAERLGGRLEDGDVRLEIRVRR